MRYFYIKSNTVDVQKVPVHDMTCKSIFSKFIPAKNSQDFTPGCSYSYFKCLSGIPDIQLIPATIFFDGLFHSSFHFCSNLRSLHVLILVIIHWLQEMHLHCQWFYGTSVKSLIRINQCNRHDRASGFCCSFETAAFKFQWMISIPCFGFPLQKSDSFVQP